MAWYRKPIAFIRRIGSDKLVLFSTGNIGKSTSMKLLNLESPEANDYI
jgi:hypothetical protein